MTKSKLLLSVILSVFTVFIFAVTASAAFLGDVNSDGNITADDARKILRVSVNLENIIDDKAVFADVDADGRITAADARSVLRASVKLEARKPFYDTEIIKEPTCTEKGIAKRINTEKDYIPPAGFPVPPAEYEEELPALGHDIPTELIEEKKATCIEEGYIKFVCPICKETVTEILPKTGHSWKEATCTEDAYCTVCGAKGEKAKGHTTNLGTCSRCGTYINKFPTLTAALKKDIASAAANTKAGYEKINKSVGAASWLPKFAAEARPYYEKALASYKNAIAACASYPELADIKSELQKCASKVSSVIAGIDSIPGNVDDSNFISIIEKIDSPQGALEGIQKKIAKVIKNW